MLSSVIRPSGGTVFLLLAAMPLLAGCNGNGDGQSFLSGVFPPAAPPAIVDLVPASGSIEPGVRLSNAPGAEDGIGGARTVALNRAYHEAQLSKAGSDLVLTLDRRPSTAGPEIVATFHSFGPVAGVFAGMAVSKTDDVSRGGTDFADGHAVFLDASPASGLEFMRFGFWAIVDASDASTITAEGGPIGTPAADLSAGARLVTATYRGTTVGGLLGPTSPYDLQLLKADITLTADFASGRIGADITGMRMADPETGADLGPGPTLSFANATILNAGPPSAPGFQGTTNDGTFSATMNGAPLGAGNFADFAGTFYGSQLEEVGGGWYVATPTSEMSGTFGAKR